MWSLTSSSCALNRETLYPRRSLSPLSFDVFQCSVSKQLCSVLPPLACCRGELSAALWKSLMPPFHMCACVHMCVYACTLGHMCECQRTTLRSHFSPSPFVSFRDPEVLFRLVRQMLYPLSHLTGQRLTHPDVCLFLSFSIRSIALGNCYLWHVTLPRD